LEIDHDRCGRETGESLELRIADTLVQLFRSSSSGLIAIGNVSSELKEIVMNELEKVLYTAKAHTTGGREGGSSRSSDGRLDIRLSSPGTPGEGTNPEQLLAAGWSACFLSAIKLIGAKKKIALPNDLAIDAEVDLGVIQGAYRLGARLNVTLPGIDSDTARSLVDGASKICPYSLVTSGNIHVEYNVNASEASDRVMETQHA
jgi:osmotically inducible protein OsmC